MEQHPFRILSWNVNGIRNRLIEVQQFCLENDVDVICLQETKHTDTTKLQLRGYQMFTISSVMGQSPYRGMITYIRNNIPATCEIDVSLGEDTQSQLINIHDEKGCIKIKLLNAYITDNKLDFSNLYDITNGYPCILVGDLNAIHHKLGKNKTQPYNNNGKKFISYLESECSIVNVINGPEPTHLLGNKLDYVCLLNDPGLHNCCEIVDTLTSDHYGIYSEIMLPDTARRSFAPRKRLHIPKKHEKCILSNMNSWYDNYIPLTTDGLNDDMINQLETNIENFSNPSKRRPHIGTLKRWYNSDEAVKRINKQYRKVKNKWEKTPTAQNLTIFKRMAQQVQEVKRMSRERYWTTFLETINHKTPPREVSKRVRIVQGEKSRVSLHPNPTQKCNELHEGWVQTSSYECLPLKVRGALLKRENKRKIIIQKALDKKHPSDNKPITQEELNQCLKAGKSTSPGVDGVTYNLVRFLAKINGNPVLRLFNMIWSGGGLPDMWKRAVMIPVSKPGRPGSYRPISLTSCLCKVFERIILNRLLYVIKTKISNNLYGFISGKSTQNCIHRVLSGIRKRYTIFIDIKGAFDSANPTAILAELSMMTSGSIIRIIKDYLTDRYGRVYFEGVYSKWERIELGTPQGGVLSPMLFNILMNVIGSLKLRGVVSTIYADDIVLQADSYSAVIAGLKEIENACNSLGLVISPEKTKVLHKRGKDSKIIKLQGKVIEEVTTYKYMGVTLGQCNHRNDEVTKIKQICLPRLTLLRKVAWGSVGSSIPVLKTLYISMIRSVIDYRASNLLNLSKARLQAVERIQNEAMRIILGCPKTAKIETMRYELGLMPITHRIQLIATLQITRSLNTLDDGTLKNAVFNPKGKLRSNKWLRSVRELLNFIDIKAHLDNNNYKVYDLPPWDQPTINPSFSDSTLRKCDVPVAMLQQDFYRRFDNISSELVLYTDGSLQIDGRAGAGVAVYHHNIYQESKSLSIRASNSSSTTTTELLGIAAALTVAKKDTGNVTIVSDSICALQSIVAIPPISDILCSRIRRLVFTIQKQKRSVYFIWTPSHSNIEGNDKADMLAKRGCFKDQIDYNFPLSLEVLKTNIMKKLDHIYSEYFNNLIFESNSVKNYIEITGGSRPNYVLKGICTRRKQTSYSRLRLQYKYFWEVTSNIRIENCRLCKQTNGHKLHHYILECYIIDKYRSGHENLSFHDTLHHFLDSKVFLKVKEEYPKFANSC